MLKDSLSNEKSEAPLTPEIVERIIKDNLDFLKARGLTPVGKPFSNQKIAPSVLIQKSLGESK